jgi:hypothetical protein
MRRTSITTIFSLFLLIVVVGQASAEDRNWDMTNFEFGGVWQSTSVWLEIAVPTNGQSVLLSKCCGENLVDIDNAGSGVNLPASALRFENKTNLYDSTAGSLNANGTINTYDYGLVDDVIIANTIAFNGAGGGAPSMYTCR